MKRVLIVLSVIVAALVLRITVVSPARAANTSAKASAMLRQAIDSGKKYTYTATGTMRLSRRGRTISSDIKIYHLKPDSTRIEYSTPPLDGVTVGVRNGLAWRRDSKLGRITVTDQGSRLNRRDKLALLLDSHRVEFDGNSRVAGRPADIVVVRSGTGDVQKRLWLDTSTYVILRSEDYTRNGRLRSSTEFRTIKYMDSLPVSLFACPKNTRRVAMRRVIGRMMALADLSRAMGFRVSRPGYVPRGYKLEGYRLHNCPCCNDMRSALSRYTNGLSSISIFELRPTSKSGTCPMDPKACVGKDTDGAQMVTITSRGRSFVVVGDVSRADLMRIARSLR